MYLNWEKNLMDLETKSCITEYMQARVHNNKSVQLPYGFYTRHLDGMT